MSESQPKRVVTIEEGGWAYITYPGLPKGITFSHDDPTDLSTFLESKAELSTLMFRSLIDDSSHSEPSSERKQMKTSGSMNQHRGTLYMRIGPMFSGKSTWLNSELTQFADKKFKVLKITHSNDQRDDVEACDDSGSTHNSSYRSLSDKIARVRVAKLKDVDVSGFHVIGIDEAQFFTDLLEFVEGCVEKKGKHVRVAGLDGDAFKHKFGQVLDLIPMADEVIKLNASCELCLAELEQAGFHGNILSIVAPFTKRLGSSKEQVVVGGSDLYIPVCRFHHSV